MNRSYAAWADTLSETRLRESEALPDFLIERHVVRPAGVNLALWFHDAVYDRDFWRQRVKILETFLSRPAIYQTAWFSARLEQRACDNIVGVIAQVEARGEP